MREVGPVGKGRGWRIIANPARLQMERGERMADSDHTALLQLGDVYNECSRRGARQISTER